MTEFAERYMSQCPHCGEPIALTHRSPLGTFEGQVRQPSSQQPVNILCVQTGQMFEYGFEAFRRRHVERQGRSSQTDVTWQIESPCKHQGCQTNYIVYAWFQGDVTEEEMLDSAIRGKPKRSCIGHEFEWDTERATVKKFNIW